MRKILKRVALTCLSLALMVGALIGLVIWYFYPSPPNPPAAKATSALAAQRQDLAYFKQLLALDRAFSRAARAEANQRIAALEALPAPLDHAHLGVALMQVTALAENGHTRLGAEPSAAPRELPDYQNFCGNLRYCFWVNYLFPIRVASFVPDVPVVTTFADWRAGRDPVYERAVELAQRHAVRTVAQRTSTN